MKRFSLLAAGLTLMVSASSSGQPSPASVDADALRLALVAYAHEPSVDVVVAAALDRAEVDPRRARRLATRARHSGWLPSVRLGVRRGVGRDASSQLTGETDRTAQSSDADLTLEAQLTFRLGAIVYGSDEVAWAREARARAALRSDIARAVVSLYFQRRRAQLERDLLHQDDLDHAVRIAELEALLDAFTDGEFLRMMAHRRGAR